MLLEHPYPKLEWIWMHTLNAPTYSPLLAWTGNFGPIQLRTHIEDSTVDLLLKISILHSELCHYLSPPAMAPSAYVFLCHLLSFKHSNFTEDILGCVHLPCTHPVCILLCIAVTWDYLGIIVSLILLILPSCTQTSKYSVYYTPYPHYKQNHVFTYNFVLLLFFKHVHDVIMSWKIQKTEWETISYILSCIYIKIATTCDS